MEYRNVNKIDARRNPVKQLLADGSLTMGAIKRPQYQAESRISAARQAVTGLARYGYGRGRPDFSGSEFSGQEVTSRRAIELEAQKRGMR
ncbi:hypothetical protein [Synechococcus elongatus]|uniref:hypothetical protein n=1 Tax=Synechococcus elongatus TaxID=32046 RepID=UPI0012600E23|nr:hypothetical protein [Synechococcus elongatus]